MQLSSDFIVLENSEFNETLGFHENADRKETEGPNATPKDLRLKNHNEPIIAYFNIKSIKKKFDFLKAIISRNIDRLAIAVTKLNDTFPISQSILDGHGGEILAYVKQGFHPKS